MVCLTDRLPGQHGPHYRVVVGYDDARGVYYVNDPCHRESEHDIDGGGPNAPDQAVRGDEAYAYCEWPLRDQLAVWQLPGDGRGLPGRRYCAVSIAPWNVEATVPAAASKGSTFDLAAEAACSRVAPIARYRVCAYPDRTGDPGSVVVSAK